MPTWFSCERRLRGGGFSRSAERDSVSYEGRGTAQASVGVGADRGTAKLSRHAPYENHGVIRVGLSVWSRRPLSPSLRPSSEVLDSLSRRM